MNPEVNNEEVDEKPRTLFVGNVPQTVRKRDLEVLFGDVGPLKRCHIQYPRNSNKGAQTSEPLVAYITYALTEDATAAIEKFAGYKLENSKLNIKLIKSRIDQYREPRFKRPIGLSPMSANLEPLPEQTKIKIRPKPVSKKSRLIVRNISFQTTEESLREHFKTCGEITDVNILKKPNGKLVGCAFVQYKNVHEAFQALKTLNSQPFLGRSVVIDWAVPKEKFQGGNKDDADATVKSEPEDDDEVKVKEEHEEDAKKQKNKRLKVEENSDDDYDDSNLDDEDDDDDEEEEKPCTRNVNSNDADEGKTLFLRNLSFDTTQEDLKTFFEKFGTLNYALICKDSLTEHPKGTGFIKFKELESSQKCLEKYEEDQSDFNLNQRQFYVSVALSKGRLEAQMNSGTEKQKKDNRHLYLAREGFIRPGSEAAIGVSISDMNKRATLQHTKKQMLKDLSVFVSDTRICIHNLPPTWKDEDLRKLFLKHAGPNAKITESRVMRDLSTLNRDSKEFGFVAFTTHEHALAALRAINNSPSIFTPNKRPIVEFSLENRKAIVAKERRLEKSKEMQVQIVKSNEEAEEKVLSKRAKRKLKKEEKYRAKHAEKVATEGNENEAETEEPVQKKKKLRHRDLNENLSEYSGLTGKEGITSLPSLKAKGKITRKSLKPSKNKLKQKQERRMREPKTRPKNSSKDVSDNIDQMVSKYKAKQGSSKGEKKWFE